MQTRLKGFWEKIKGFFAKLNKKTRILLGVCAAVILVLIIAAVALSSNKNEYEVLCTGLTSSETSSVIQFLSENGVTDYRIKNDSILVPTNRVDQLKVQLATSNLLNTGFFYESYFKNIGTFSTETERKEALRIATEEKLAAMIRDFEGVRDAQVTISLGADRNYVLQPTATSSTAAVKITPDGNQQLNSGVVESIRYTVSHSVKELNISDVSIVDTYGNVYNDSSSAGAIADASVLQWQYEQETNNRVRNQVLQALEPIYGKGNVSVAVNTRVDMNRKVVESTQYSQPQGSVEGGGLIGTEKWYWALGGDTNVQAGGVVGAGPNSDVITYPTLDGNVTGNEDNAAASGDRVHHLDTTVTQQEVLAGRITDVNVAVSINQNCENAGAMSVERLTNHVAVASGIGTELENWGSHVSVEIAPFANTQPVEPGDPEGPFELIPGVPNWVVLAAIGGLILFVILLVIILILRGRRKKKKLAAQLAAEAEQREAEEAAEAAAAAAAIIAAAPTGGADIMEVNTEKSMELRKTVRQFAQNNPEIAAQMVKAWLKGDENSA